jgi:hypothetical protein
MSANTSAMQKAALQPRVADSKAAATSQRPRAGPRGPATLRSVVPSLSAKYPHVTIQTEDAPMWNDILKWSSVSVGSIIAAMFVQGQPVTAARIFSRAALNAVIVQAGAMFFYYVVVKRVVDVSQK